MKLFEVEQRVSCSCGLYDVVLRNWCELVDMLTLICGWISVEDALYLKIQVFVFKDQLVIYQLW